MKDKKSYLVLLPILVFVFTFVIIYRLSASFAINSDTAIDEGIPSGTVYRFIRKNTYSWHLIDDSFEKKTSGNASGTKLIQSVDGGYKAVVYCASEGDNLSSDSRRVRYSLDEIKYISSRVKERWSLLMPYMYPYINLGATSSDAGTLKSILKSSDLGLGNAYDNYDFDSLNVNEVITATQAAIWNIQNSTDIYVYKDTLSDFSPSSKNGNASFENCSDYYSGKVITSEEEAWYSQDGCSKNGNFYKYVFNHKKDSNTAYRINILIDWYTSYLEGKLQNSGKANTASYFKVQDNSFDNSTKVLTINTETNLNNPTIVFKDNANNKLTATKSGNTYTITNVSDNVSSITWDVTAVSNDKNVYYYRADEGQDFIGLETGKYTTKGTIVVERPVEPEPTPEPEPEPEPTPEPVIKKGNIIIYKKSATSDGVTIVEQSNSNFDVSKCGSSATDCLSNSKFELYYGDEKVLYKITETSYNDTSTVVFNDLPLGTYWLKETQPAHGYDIYPSGTRVEYPDGTTGTIGQDGLIKIELTDTQTFGVIVNNTPTKICFTKLDASNNNATLGGAQYQIQDIDGMAVEVFETSGNVGQEKYCIEGQLQAGSYIIREISAPSGYSLDAKRYHFVLGRGTSSIANITDIGSPQTVVPVNDTITFTDKKEVEISKSDATTGACVKGAELVVRDSNGEIVKNNSGVEVGKWTSTCECDNDPLMSGLSEEALRSCNSQKISLNPGTYTLTETMTEELRQQGYSSESETITFVVDENGKVATPVDMKDAPIKVCIHKVDQGTNELLEGATFNLYKEDGKTLYKKITTSTNESNNCLSYVPYGTYYVKEIKAPEGYVALEEEVKIEVKDTKDIQNFYIENEVEAPKTALNNTKLLMTISSIFMVFGVCLVGYYVIKKKA